MSRSSYQDQVENKLKREAMDAIEAIQPKVLAYSVYTDLCEASSIARAALAPKEEACTGAGDCPATTHLHGCYRDDGNCDHPDHHDAAPTKEKHE